MMRLAALAVPLRPGPNPLALRLVGYPSVLGAQSQVDWTGTASNTASTGSLGSFNGSRRTAYVDYVIVGR
jgi:hypothetical protein